MPKIKIVPSMVLDAICFIEKFNYGSDRNLLPEQTALIEKIEGKTNGKLKIDCLSSSSLCGVLTAYAENADFENYTLDDLSSLFKNPEDMRDIVKSKITNEFQTSYTYPLLDSIVNEWAEKYIKMLDILKESGFDKLWKSDLLPLIQEDIKKKEKVYGNLDIDRVLEDIEKLKCCEPLGDVKIYVSFMSFPVAFKLHGNAFLDCIRGNRGAGIICHELMHGFATEELTNLYLEYIHSIKYLTEQHDMLINEMHSGNEEEFVMAAEYYLRMKYIGEDRKILLKGARNAYNGCMPVSVFLFDLLSKESETPNDYARWLTDIFKNKKLPKKAIERNLDIICPREEIEIYHDKMFGCFKRMIEKAIKIRASESFNIAKKIESVVNQKFEDITQSIGKSVYFAQERQPLPNALKVKELFVDNLFINIAEFEDNSRAMYDTIIYSGTNIGVPSEEINGRWCPPYCVNILNIGKTPVTVSISFIKDKYRVSFTARCPDYVNTGAEYPSNLKEMHEYWDSNKEKSWEERQKRDAELGIPPYEKFVVKYFNEILSTQKKIEDVIMKL